MSDIALTGLTKAFGSVPVLRGIDLRVPSGGVTAILGPSGCGKTTLLRLIAGFERPDAGWIEVDSERVCGPGRWVPPERRHIGYVAQEGALFPHLTVGGNLAFGMNGRYAATQSAVAELLELVGLEASHAVRYPHQLSGGQQQRVALARALAPRPSVVLLDEPFSSLDAALRDGTRRAVMRALGATGTTAILVTHDQAEALSAADQVAVMLEGSLVQVGTPATLYATPVNLRVARFLGEANVLPAQVCAGVATCGLGALRVHGEHVDGPAEVLIRPEQIALLPPGTSKSVAARLVERTYYGPHATLQLELRPSGVLVNARVAGYQTPPLGGDVGLTVQGPVVAYPQPT